MELLIAVGIMAVIVFLNIGLYLPSLLTVTGEEIGENITRLKQEKWFTQFLHHEQYRQLIIHDQHVRKAIGRLHTEKLVKESYARRSERKIEKVLLKQLSSSV